MGLASFNFHGELNQFLTAWRRGKILDVPFEGNPSVKHMIEALRVPHTEVGDIRVNGAQVDFSYQVQDGDRVEVFPVVDGAAQEQPLAPVPEYRGKPLGMPRFLLDNHLGKLATYLRVLGFDAQYRNDYQDEELAQVASLEGRILLTRDRGLLMRKAILHGYCLRTMYPKQQLVEVVRRFDLWDLIQPFQRCLRCNSPLQPVSKAEVLDRLEPLTKRYYDEFHICPQCKQIYWKGSHYARMKKLIEEVISEQ